MTSNLGGGEITELMGGGYGFIKSDDKPKDNLDVKVERTAVEAARRKFSPEFMNRLDKVVVFHPLQRKQLEEVLDIELTMVQQRVLETAKGQFLFRVTEQGRDFLLEEGTDQRYGARHLKRAIERHVVYPMANLLATEQVHFGDLICVDRDNTEMNLSFVREGENVAMPVRRAEPLIAHKPSQARGGRPVEAPGIPMPPEPAPRFAR
jgi:ATP-dependent Clp protease ATP-binding subunit ClpA